VTGRARTIADLPAKLAAEAPGILAWAIQGCLEWQRDGLRIPRRVKAATAQYRASQDHVGRFMAECCTVDPDAYVSAKALRETYEGWCAEQGEKPWSARSLGGELSDRGFDVALRGSSSQRARTWLGFGLAADEGERL